MLALDPGLFMPIDEFRARVDRLIDDMKSSDKAEGTQEILVPGELEMRARQQNLAAGNVPLLPSTLKRLVDYQQEVGLTTKLEVV
jgi:LDH2 family malate/lactate/ureidoglycolate dehydrogenase